MIDRDEADVALRDIAGARARAGELRGYALSGGVLIAWGLVWLVCNLASQIDPVHGPASWGMGVPIGIAASVLTPGRRDLRVFGVIAIAMAFVVGVIAITGAASPRSFGVLVVWLVAASYGVLGLWVGRRFLIVGAALAACALIGWFVVPDLLFLMLGLGGGGVLILSGLWMRRA